MQGERFLKAIEAFDLANAKDPNQVVWKGETYPKELLYAQRMTECLNTYLPAASEALHLAARCQHLCRWEIPRNTYPQDRKGYYAWRNALKEFHADKASEILYRVGYEDTIIQEVRLLLSKKQMKHHADSQVLEDVICLVFLQYYMDEFAEHTPEEKMITILQKTWRKMSERAQQEALHLSLSEKSQQLVSAALNVES
ncbi:MAG: DUF4202 domain-containing protein [Bacteroidota bacterium]